jgi:hypothetical protein
VLWGEAGVRRFQRGAAANMAPSSSFFESLRRGVCAGSKMAVLIGPVAAPGCLPYAVPPARISIGSAARSGVVVTSAGAPARPSYGLVRAGIHPLDAIDEELPVDVGVGYEAEFVTSGQAPTVEGGYVELGAYPLKARLAPNLTLRAGAYGAVAGLARSGTSGLGIGGALGGVLELTGKVNGTGSGVSEDGTMLAGYASGRWAIGLFGTGAVRDFSDGAYRSAAAGVSVRIPFLAGVICCATPHASDSHRVEHHHEAHPHEAAPEQHLARTPAVAEPKRTPATPRRAE